MDPITIAILAALTAGAAAGITDISKRAIKDAYDGLKTVIKRKFGDKNNLSEAIENLEGKPESEGRKLTLQEEVASAKAAEDADIIAAVQELREMLKDTEDERIQNMIRSEGGQQMMRGGPGGKQEQNMTDSPHGSQTQE